MGSSIDKISRGRCGIAKISDETLPFFLTLWSKVYFRREVGAQNVATNEIRLSTPQTFFVLVSSTSLLFSFLLKMRGLPRI